MYIVSALIWSEEFLMRHEIVIRVFIVLCGVIVVACALFAFAVRG